MEVVTANKAGSGGDGTINLLGASSDENGVGKENNSAVTNREKFLQVYSVLKAEILADTEGFEHTLESRAWTEKNMDHNVPGGKLNRGLSVVDSARLLKEGGALTEAEVFRACALGWCIEWLQGYFLVMDDIMDHSITRRGQPCWYKMSKVGLIAINDGILLSSHIFLILKRHFKSEPYYADLLDLFNEVSYQTASGQMLDLITTPEGEVDISKYTISTYNKIVQYKTAYYSFYLPVACAMMLVGEKDESQFEAAKGILVQMGTYFQVQDDFLDCFGDPAVIGKVGTDIEDTKCSWLVVQALQRASSQQRELLKRIYGKADPDCVGQVKQLYNDLKLKEVFEEYEAQSYTELRQGIGRQISPAYQAVFLAFLGKIYKRQK